MFVLMYYTAFNWAKWRRSSPVCLQFNTELSVQADELDRFHRTGYDSVLTFPHSLVHPPTHSLTHSLNHSPTHSPSTHTYFCCLLLHFVIPLFLFPFVAPSSFFYIFRFIIHYFCLLAFFNSLLISYIFLTSKSPILNAPLVIFPKFIFDRTNIQWRYMQHKNVNDFPIVFCQVYMTRFGLSRLRNNLNTCNLWCFSFYIKEDFMSEIY